MLLNRMIRLELSGSMPMHDDAEIEEPARDLPWAVKVTEAPSGNGARCVGLVCDRLGPPPRQGNWRVVVDETNYVPLGEPPQPDQFREFPISEDAAQVWLQRLSKIRIGALPAYIEVHDGLYMAVEIFRGSSLLSVGWAFGHCDFAPTLEKWAEAFVEFCCQGPNLPKAQ